MTATRRERLRAETLEDIKAAALAQIAESGAGALSMRGIARRIGMSPAGLYRYFENLDGLITALIADAYNDLADHVLTATDREGSVADRLAGAMLSYREWCLAYPNRFLLIFGTPIPGYEAPENGPTVEAMRRMGGSFFALAAEGWVSGEMSVVPLPRPLEPSEVEFAASIAPDFPPEMVSVCLSLWAHWHGLVNLEVLNQLDWIYPDPDAFYRGEVARIIDRLTQQAP
jgi:AcrR family transcriptional regulator